VAAAARHAQRVGGPRRGGWPTRRGVAHRRGEAGAGVGEAEAAEVLTYLRGKTRGQGRAAAADAIVEATRMDGEGQGGPTRQPHR